MHTLSFNCGCEIQTDKAKTQIRKICKTHANQVFSEGLKEYKFD